MAEFDRFAEDYQRVLNDAIRWSRDTSEYFCHHKAVSVATLCRDAPPLKVLDYGCGVGAVTRYLVSVFPAARVDGFDVSEDSLLEVPAEVRARGLFSADLNDFEADYDLIVICNVLHHVDLEDRESTVRQLGKRLRVGGRLVVFEHNPLNPVTRRVVATCPFDENAVLLWPRESMRLLKEAGMADLNHKYVLFFPGFLRRLRGLERHLGWLPFGAQYMAWGTRAA